VKSAESPIWILRFPTRARGFYYIEDHEKSGYNVDYDLLLPGGYGEVLDGGCREYRYEKLLDKIKQHGEDSSKYSWFLELTRAGLIRPTCGWAVSVIKVGWGCLGFISP
jgi:asparaginyl-tRNA synthetase